MFKRCKEQGSRDQEVPAKMHGHARIYPETRETEQPPKISERKPSKARAAEGGTREGEDGEEDGTSEEGNCCTVRAEGEYEESGRRVLREI